MLRSTPAKLCWSHAELKPGYVGGSGRNPNVISEGCPCNLRLFPGSAYNAIYFKVARGVRHMLPVRF